MDDIIKVLIVDDSIFMRNMLERVVKSNPQMQVVGKAENGEQAVELVKSLKPDVVTLDIEMPIMNGLQALEKIMNECSTAVIMVSTLTKESADETIKALSLGAVDFIPKSLESSQDNIFKKSELIQEKIIAAAKSKVNGKVSRFTKTEEKIAEEKVIMPKMTGYLKRASYKNTPQILVIGSSTGGPKALDEVISNLSPNFKLPVVVAQHMPEGFTQALADRMNRMYHLNIKEAEDAEVLKPGNVYIAPGGKHLRVSKRLTGLVAEISEDKGESVFKPSVNVLAESVNKALGGDSIAIMLTGMGSDGAKGFKSLKDSGAYIITQDEETCTVYGMPKSVVDLNASDEQLPVNEISNVVNVMVNNKK